MSAQAIHNSDTATAHPPTVWTISTCRQPAILSYLTIEVPIFILFFTISLSTTVFSNLLIDRTCRVTLGYNETDCSLLGTDSKSQYTKDLESKVQPYTTKVLMVQSLLEGICPAILAFFLGPWSDKYGRKPLINGPLLGYALTSVVYIVFSMISTLDVWWTILSAIPFSIFGGASALFTGVYCYINDITTEASRSFRLSMLEASVLGGSLLGSLASPYAFGAMGYNYLFILNTTLGAIAFFYSLLFIEESVNAPVSGGILDIFEIKHVKSMLKTCFKPRPNYNRAIVFLLILIKSLAIFSMYGLYLIDFLYVREKLQWTLKDYSIFSAVSTVLMVAGLFFGTTILQKCCHLRDSIVIIIAFISFIIEALLKSTATKTIHMYIAVSVTLLRSLAAPLIQSIISKIVPNEDVSKVFAFISAMEAVLPIIAPLVYNMVYGATLLTYSGVVYLITAGIMGVCLVCAGIIHYLLIRYPIQHYSLNIND